MQLDLLEVTKCKACGKEDVGSIVNSRTERVPACSEQCAEDLTVFKLEDGEEIVRKLSTFHSFMSF